MSCIRSYTLRLQLHNGGVEVLLIVQV